MERPSSTCYLAVVIYFGFISLMLSGMFALIFSSFLATNYPFVCPRCDVNRREVS